LSIFSLQLTKTDTPSFITTANCPSLEAASAEILLISDDKQQDAINVVIIPRLTLLTYFTFVYIMAQRITMKRAVPVKLYTCNTQHNRKL